MSSLKWKGNAFHSFFIPRTAISIQPLSSLSVKPRLKQSFRIWKGVYVLPSLGFVLLCSVIDWLTHFPPLSKTIRSIPNLASIFPCLTPVIFIFLPFWFINWFVYSCYDRPAIVTLVLFLHNSPWILTKHHLHKTNITNLKTPPKSIYLSTKTT